MVTAHEAPDFGTPEWDWWARGAAAEAKVQTEGMTKDALQVYLVAKGLGRNGEDADRIVESIACIFTCVWPLRQRIRLAWRILRPVSRRREVKVYREPRDLWIGYYRGERHHYVCPFPTLVIRWRRR